MKQILGDCGVNLRFVPIRGDNTSVVNLPKNLILCSRAKKLRLDTIILGIMLKNRNVYYFVTSSN